MAERIKAMQFNLRDGKECDKKHGNHWDQRKDAVAAFIVSQAPDLVSLVECDGSMEQSIQKRTAGSSYRYQSDGGARNRVMYNSDRLELAKRHKSVALPGDLGPDRRFHHLEIYDFKVRSNGQLLRFVCTHFIYNSDKHRTGSGKILAEQVAKAKDLTWIVCGDMNAKKNSNPFKTSTGNGLLRDAVRDAGKKALSKSTWCGWRGADSSGTSCSGHIDWILFYNGGPLKLKPVEAAPHTQPFKSKKYLSDHFPIMVTFDMSSGVAAPRGTKRPHAEVENELPIYEVVKDVSFWNKRDGGGKNGKTAAKGELLQLTEFGTDRHKKVAHARDKGWFCYDDPKKGIAWAQLR